MKWAVLLLVATSDAAAWQCDVEPGPYYDLIAHAPVTGPFLDAGALTGSGSTPAVVRIDVFADRTIAFNEADALP